MCCWPTGHCLCKAWRAEIEALAAVDEAFFRSKLAAAVLACVEPPWRPMPSSAPAAHSSTTPTPTTSSRTRNRIAEERERRCQAAERLGLSRRAYERRLGMDHSRPRPLSLVSTDACRPSNLLRPNRIFARPRCIAPSCLSRTPLPSPPTACRAPPCHLSRWTLQSLHP